MMHGLTNFKFKEVSCLTAERKADCFGMLIKHVCTELLTSKPFRCNIIHYQCKVTPGEPLVGHSRPIPFSLRIGARAQIIQMLEDNIIEVPNCSHLNPPNFFLRKGKIARTRLDARPVNKWPLTGTASAPPINESSQKFHGSRFITTTDLLSAFLQIGSQEESRQYTEFLSECQVYQYTRTPHGFRCFCICVRYSCALSDFKIYLEHLDTVLRRLRSASFTVSAEKCHFCRKKFTFLGHAIREGIAAVLSYPSAENRRQLRHFLDVTNYRHKFVMGYANFRPLLALPKKRIRRKRPPELQEAFEVLRA